MKKNLILTLILSLILCALSISFVHSQTSNGNSIINTQDQTENRNNNSSPPGPGGGGTISSGGSRPKRLLSDAQRYSTNAATVFNEIMAVRDKAIPKELLDKAEAIAVFPGVVKAAFIVGGRGGQGVISRRTPNGWDAPAFFNLGGGSFGAQTGAQKTDYVLLIMNQEVLRGLLEDKFEIGAEASIAGPVGRTAGASTNATLDADILSYSRSKGTFIGASLQGAIISPNNDLNEAIYDGKQAIELLTSESGMTMRNIPAQVRLFPQTLARYSKR